MREPKGMRTMNTFTLSGLFQKLQNLGLETLFQGKAARQTFSDTTRDLCQTLLQLKGEASSVAIAEEILHHYRGGSPEEKQSFFRYLHDELGADSTEVNKAIKDWQTRPSGQNLQSLAAACEPPRLELLRTLNAAPGGTLALISMREDLLKLPGDEPAFAVIDEDLLRLFRSWFNRGFLQLRRIDWQTPALILEKLIQYESVHEIKGWPDLRRRLESDRGCFGFFHPAIPDVPLIFVEAALTDAMSNDVGALLRQEPPQEGTASDKLPNTAVFYSINNCLQGLRGVSFGNFLIKHVIEHLATEAPHITQYVTLSPVPGFMKWLKAEWPAIVQAGDSKTGPSAETKAAVDALLKKQLNAEQVAASAPLQNYLPVLAARYLVQAKSRDKPADPVARFHLGNGARLERINWMADASPNGLAQSAGLMVNYVYDRKTMARNHEAYEQKNEVAYSLAIKKLLPSPTVPMIKLVPSK
jgi:malonyl-CoA decarboxylase